MLEVAVIKVVKYGPEALEVQKMDRDLLDVFLSANHLGLSGKQVICGWDGRML